ncbi:alpha/beta-hydrolase family protein [Rhodococcus rhodochrous]|uniref:Alpha/beta-hydrolase family protein n=1 Tax=Rhodococcus rhodochrous TaxID=1829 RepID=A0AAW4XQ10_RHORH|nr:alpha/beta-hydrolase family protein [Rhodococcus rhodochrous]MCD2114670.1 alpha/beta-hydrolase family protein [Rhodococcus rhodochrous]
MTTTLDTPPAPPEPEPSFPALLRERTLRWLGRFHPVGLAVALLFNCWSLSPSLLPRPWYLQGVATGISVITGYGIGVLLAWIVRKCGVETNWSATVRKVGWYLLALAAVVVVPAFLVLGSWWQDISRELVEMEPGSSWDYPGVLLVAVVVALLLLVIGRGLRRVAQWVTGLVVRVLPAPLARIVSVVLVGLIVFWAVEGLLSVQIARIANGSAMAVDEGTADGVEQPQTPERSGSDASLERWDSLGREGRTFVAGGPYPEEITAVTGEPAMMPIRVYAGYRSLDSLDRYTEFDEMEVLASHVVAELDRTGAFDREYLAVATTTGRGWVNQDVAAALEFLSDGDSAIAAMQYSFLASPLAFLADRVSPRNAGRALFEAVYARWSVLDPTTRPKLLVFGESLGSYGGQSAFAGVQDMITRTDGALWVGTPNFTEQWRRITDSRDPGSREILPVIYGGQNVRFAATPDDLTDLDGLRDWGSPRIVYWQHPSDPIVWWSSQLVRHRPDWLRDERGADIDQGMSWIPFVTFWQVTLDMVFAAEVPGGHGHAYTAEAAFFWADILGIEDESRVAAVFDALSDG